MKNCTLSIMLLLFTLTLIGQESEIQFIGNYEKLELKFSEDSIVVFSGVKHVTNFVNKRSHFRKWYINGIDVARGNYFLFQDRIIHIILYDDNRRGSLSLGVWSHIEDSNKYELQNDYIKIIDNREMFRYYGIPVSIEFFDSSILFLIDQGEYYFLKSIPNIEAETLELLQFNLKIEKD